MPRKTHLGLTASIVAISMAMTAPGQSSAQESPSSEDTVATLDKIIVTARKREESLSEIPLSVSVFSEDAIEDAGFDGLDDISLQTTGFQFSVQGGQEPGRYNTQLRFRGMSTAQFSPSFATGALFIDGVYVLNGGTSLSLMDVAQVEVIKGPQSAYFGRNTFGGAVNYITRNPNVEEFDAQIEASVSDRGSIDLSGIAEVPLIKDKLALSIAGRLYDKRGHYVATDGGRLGNEKTTTLNSVLYFEPTNNFSLKLRGSYSKDDDGAPAAGFVSGLLNDSCTGLTFTTPSGETATPRNYICGQVPGIDDAITATGQSIFSQNTSIFPANTTVAQDISGLAGNPSENFLIDGILSNPLPNGVPNVTEIGLERELIRFSASSEYVFDNDYTLNAILGYNEQNTNWIRDLDLTDNYNLFSRDPQAAEDLSAELRLTSPQDGRLRWVVGVNYYEQKFTSDGGGGDFGLACIVGAPTTDFADCFSGFVLSSGFANNDESEVLGIFAALDFDLTDQLTLSLEGRQQNDTLKKAGTLGADGIGDDAQSLESKNFLPRVILRYQPVPETNLYASFSQGVLQGDINTLFANADENERQQYLSQIANLSSNLPEEKLDAWEIGLKQSLYNGRLNVNLAAYYNEWTGIKGRSSAVVFETCNAARISQANCAGVALGDPANTPITRSILVPGDADLWGIEFESAAAISDNWEASLNVTWAKSEYKDYLFNFVTPISGFSNMRGNQQPRFPEWSGNFSSTYTMPLSNGWDVKLRGDIIYFGEAFVDESNLAFTEDYFLANARLGFEKDNMRWELFAKNLFDEDAYSAGARWSDFSIPTFFPTALSNQGVAVSPQDKREFGVRAIIDF